MNKTILFLFSTLMCVVSFVCGCNNSDVIENSVSKRTLKVSDMNHVGEFHNEMMSYAVNKISLDEFTVSKFETAEDLENYVVDCWNKKLVKEVTSAEDIECLKVNMNKFKSFLQGEKFLDRCVRNMGTRASNEVDLSYMAQVEEIEIITLPSLEGMVSDIKTQGICSSIKCDFFDKIVDLVSDSYNGTVSGDIYNERLNSIVEDFDNANFSPDDSEAQMIASVLSVGTYSSEWWSENSEEIPVEILETGKMPHVLAADLAGALIGGVVNLGGQAFTSTSNRFNWKSFGWGVACGAITGSTGLLGRIVTCFYAIENPVKEQTWTDLWPVKEP